MARDASPAPNSYEERYGGHSATKSMSKDIFKNVSYNVLPNIDLTKRGSAIF